jgi:hypothetical protein
MCVWAHLYTGTLSTASQGDTRPNSVYHFPRQARTLCPQLCMGIQPGARFPARSADALPATLYGHFTQAIYRNRPIARPCFQAFCKKAQRTMRRRGIAGRGLHSSTSQLNLSRF